ncbi:MAG: iron ABC transporter permease [Ahrensia sp.]|nr:iron ABC transporter permease [Ahrensia sp.]
MPKRLCNGHIHAKWSTNININAPVAARLFVAEPTLTLFLPLMENSTSHPAKGWTDRAAKADWTGKRVDFGRIGLGTIAYVAAAICAVPIVAVTLSSLLGDASTFARLSVTLLPGYAFTTLRVMMMVAFGTLLVGTATAWIIAAFDFRGRKLLEAALVIPLAFPAYVLAYAYTDLLDHPGAVQTLLRDLTGWGPRDYWFPEIRSEGGAALMLILVLYPYVYLLARAALIMQGLVPFMVARSLGSSPLRAFFRVALPMITPAVAGGVLLALMETIADFGTVAHFGVQTLATGIYTAWFTLGDRTASAQIALGLLVIALFLVMLQRLTSRAEKSIAQGKNARFVPRMRLEGAKAALACAICATPVLFGALTPTIMLINLASASEQSWLSERYWDFVVNSLSLATIAAIVTVTAAITLSSNRRAHLSRSSRLAVGMARLGYAVPGGVIAVGLFVPFATFDNALDAWAREALGVSTGLLISGSIALLIMAYVIRFMAAALAVWQGGEETVSRNMDESARSLGAGVLSVMRQIHIPLLAPAGLTALLIVFVDVMKELPATLIVRPFGWDTLAVQAYRLAADERLEGAAVPSLMIVAVGLLPVILLCRQIDRIRSDRVNLD